jgi:hypothetical protein
MIKARHIILRAEPEQRSLLKTFQRMSSLLARHGLSRNRLLCRNKQVDRQGEPANETKELIIICTRSQTIQSLTDKFVANHDTIANLRRQGSNIRYPGR